jgi:hypothetical protein
MKSVDASGNWRAALVELRLRRRTSLVGQATFPSQNRHDISAAK